MKKQTKDWESLGVISGAILLLNFLIVIKLYGLMWGLIICGIFSLAIGLSIRDILK